jgi:septal ring factor EnvC (AmiA/AmiB activator)
LEGNLEAKDREIEEFKKLLDEQKALQAKLQKEVIITKGALQSRSEQLKAAEEKLKEISSESKSEVEQTESNKSLKVSTELLHIPLQDIL